MRGVHKLLTFAIVTAAQLLHAAPIPAALRRSVLNAPGSGLDTLQGQQDQASKLDPRVNLGEVIDMAKILDSAGANVDASAAKASSELAAGDAAEMLPKQTGRRTSRRVSKPKYTAEVEFMNRPNIPGPQKTGPRPKGQEFTAEQKRANSLATRRRYYWNTVRPKLVLTRSEDKREANRYRESQRLASIRHSEKKMRLLQNGTADPIDVLGRWQNTRSRSARPSRGETLVSSSLADDADTISPARDTSPLSLLADAALRYTD